MYKTPQSGTTFGSSDAEKLYAAVAKCTFESQNVKKLSCSQHFLMFYCGSDAEKLYAAVAKCTFESQNVKKLSCSQHFLMFYSGLHAAVAKCTFESQNVKKLSCSQHFLMFYCGLYAAVAKCTFESQNVKKLSCSQHFLTFYCGKIACRCGQTRMCKWKWSKTVVCGALLDVLMTILRKAVSSARSVFELVASVPKVCQTCSICSRHALR